MAGASLSQTIKDKVEADAGIMAILTGGVWTRPIVRDQSPDPNDPTRGSTPDAFETIQPYRIKPCLSIAEGTQDKNSSGVPGAMFGFPTLWLRSQPKDTEKAKLEDVFLRLKRLFDAKPLPMPSGAGCIVSMAGRMGPIDDPVISGAVVMMVRLQIDGIWEVTP